MAAAPPIVFNYAAFVAGYPEFAGLSEPQAQAYFDRAGLFFENTGRNPAACSGNMGALFNLLVAHIAWLTAPRDANGNPASAGQPPSPIVGRVSSASEGSVSVSAEWKGSGSPSEEWYLQSQWGAEFWQATAQYRMFRYFANPTIVPGAAFPYRGRFGIRRY